MRSGQAAIETMIILSISVLILMFIGISSQGRLSSEYKRIWDAQVRTSLEKLANTADFVFSQSLNATASARITVPPTVVSINVNNNSFEFVMNYYGVNSSRISVTTTPLKGFINLRSGEQEVMLKNEGDYVRVYTR